MNYWEECISSSLEEAGIKATQEQIEQIASDVQIAHENYGMFMGHDCIPNPLKSENERLSQELKKEQDMVICKTCKGRGWIVESFGPGLRSSESQCWKCHGRGRHSP